MKKCACFLILLAGFFSLAAASAFAAAAASLVHDGDRWVCLGDSITAQNIYPRILGRVFAHYHPEATLTVINSGVGGDTASDSPKKLADRVLKHQPTVVSVMYGMNETLTREEGTLDRYRKNLTYITRSLKEQGITVILMSPTLTDPACSSTFYNLFGTVPFLRRCSAVMKEVATKEGALYVPMQEELEKFEKTLPDGVILRPDGVHPTALGQYEMARIIWERANFAGPLNANGPRILRAPKKAAPRAALAVGSRFVEPKDGKLQLVLQSYQAEKATLNWSLSDLHRTETLDLKAGETPWTPDIPADGFPSRNGQNADLLVELRDEAGSELYIIDLCRTAVFRFDGEGKIRGSVESAADRPEGKRVADWTVRREGQGLVFSGEVFDSEINSSRDWPFARDGFNLMFDFRPTPRFADIGVDREVHQTLLNVYERPFLSVGLREWAGANMGFAAVAAGAKTATGYTTQLFINDKFYLKEPVNLDNRDFVGLLVSVNDLDTDPANPQKTTLTIHSGQRNDYGVNLYANNLMVIDLKNRLSGDSVINVHLFPADH